MAFQKLQNLERRLTKDPRVAIAYCEIIENNLSS